MTHNPSRIGHEEGVWDTRAETAMAHLRVAGGNRDSTQRLAELQQIFTSLTDCASDAPGVGDGEDDPVTAAVAMARLRHVRGDRNGAEFWRAQAERARQVQAAQAAMDELLGERPVQPGRPADVRRRPSIRGVVARLLTGLAGVLEVGAVIVVLVITLPAVVWIRNRTSAPGNRLRALLRGPRRGPLWSRARGHGKRDLRRALSALVVLELPWRDLQHRALAAAVSRYRYRVLALDSMFVALAVSTTVAAIASLFPSAAPGLAAMWPHATHSGINLALHGLPTVAVIAVHIMVHQMIARAVSSAAFVSQALKAVVTCAAAETATDADIRHQYLARLDKQVNRLVVQLRRSTLSPTLPVKWSQRRALSRHFRLVARALLLATRQARAYPDQGLPRLATLLSTAANRSASRTCFDLLDPDQLTEPAPPRLATSRIKHAGESIQPHLAIFAGLISAGIVVAILYAYHAPARGYPLALVAAVSAYQVWISRTEGANLPTTILGPIHFITIQIGRLTDRWATRQPQLIARRP